MKGSKIKAGVAIVVAVLIGSAPAWAGTRDVHFDAIVPPLGRMINLGCQYKAITGASAHVKVDQTGGRYGNYYRVTKNIYRSQPIYLKQGGSGYINVSDYYKAGDYVCLQAQSGNWTFVNVHVSGKWRSN